MNAMLIVGCAAMVAPMTISKSTVRKDIPFAVFASVLLPLLALDSFLGRIDGVILLAGFAAFMYYTLSQAKGRKAEPATEIKTINHWMSAFFVFLGLALLVIGSNIFVDSASRVAYSRHQRRCCRSDHRSRRYLTARACHQCRSSTQGTVCHSHRQCHRLQCL